MNKIYCLVLLLFSAIGYAETLADKLQVCASHIDNERRLNCYDELVKPLNVNTAQNQKVQEQTILAEPEVKVVPPTVAKLPVEILTPKEETVAEFGLEHKIIPADQEDKIYSVVNKIEKDSYKRLIIHLDNAQVWKQTDNEFFRLKVKQQIYVERGLLNSFFLSTDDLNRKIRVQRIK